MFGDIEIWDDAVRMDGFAQIERRIERLCARASCAQIDDRLAAELDELLEEGHLYALRADAAARRLRERLNGLLKGACARTAAEEVWRLTAEQRLLDDSARRLRERLSCLRALVGRSARPCPNSG